MSVFFRWGVFGILAVAALLYVYNASKHLSERHVSRPAAASPEPEQAEAADADADAAQGDEPETEAETETETEVVPDLPQACDEELRVAERALKMRRDGEPLDRLLRMDLIVLQPQASRRERLQAVAAQWFERAGRDPDAAGLRREILRDCRNASAASPAP